MSTKTSPALESRFADLIATEIGSRRAQVESAAALLAEGATVPFIARYRKEATGGLLDEQLETLAKRREYFLELTERRDAILASIEEQGRLTDELAQSVRSALTKQQLEDLYLPYKPKRRTRAQIARERGLEPLADRIVELAGTERAPAELAEEFVSSERDIADADAALAGARDILAERIAEDATNRARLRERMEESGALRVRVVDEEKEGAAVFRDYFDHTEPARGLPSHRMLAIARGEREGVLVSTLELDDDAEIAQIGARWGVPLTTPCGREIADATADGYRRLLRPSISTEVRQSVKERAETEAIAVFRDNLEALLLQSPLGELPVLGLDPAYRTGSKLAVCDPTGRVVATGVVHPVAPNAREKEAAAKLLDLVKTHAVKAVAVGNGTGSRETERFVRQLFKSEGIAVTVVIVPETGASVYSASETARAELPDLDVAVRGAVSIARRLQDPLAELVKIEPRSLGVGQYQHDVDQRKLARELDIAVEKVVNRVGIELNSASASLLRRTSGLSERIAKSIVAHREANGPFKTRGDLLAVDGFGPRTFELAAGFLRLRTGEHPLDRTAVHPERYKVVEGMARELGVELRSLVGDANQVARLDWKRFASDEEGLGEFTLEDIRRELERPGRDPRPEFEAPAWRDDVVDIESIETGMTLEGRVSNVTNFGAFVDLGVKRDGLVHLSELSHEWVDDPRDVVRVGQVVKVKVLEVDRERGRVGLSMKALTPASAGRDGPRAGGRTKRDRGPDRAGRESSTKSTSASPRARREQSKSPGASRDDRRKHERRNERRNERDADPTRETTVDDLLEKWGRRH